jgi:hypothetical protein
VNAVGGKDMTMRAETFATPDRINSVFVDIVADKSPQSAE